MLVAHAATRFPSLADRVLVAPPLRTSPAFSRRYDIALMMDRLLHARNTQPSAGVLDSQTVKAPAALESGYDAN
jgi:hypothetical protein